MERPQSSSTRLFRRIAEIRCERSSEDGSLYCIDTRAMSGGTYTVMITFDAREYPMNQHYRYVHHRNSALPYTFPNMEFAESPPGVRCGPWPGWGGIPPMPQVSIDDSVHRRPVAFQFWGDECSNEHVRGVCTVELGESASVMIFVPDRRLVPQKAEFYSGPRKFVLPMAATLMSEHLGRYPRLLLSNNEIDALRAKKDSTHRHLWKRIEELLRNSGIPPLKSPESKAVEGPERLFGEDRILLFALRALLIPSDRNVECARQAFFEYVEQSRRDDFEPLKIDTQSGEVLFTMCLSYDWLYGFLSLADRKRGKDRLWEVAEICWGYLGYERGDFGQAHYLGCGLGLLAFSFLFWETHPRAQEWVHYFRAVVDRVVTMLPVDGFYPHGINLWVYEYGFLLRWIELFRKCAGVNLWKNTLHWENASSFRAAATSPDGLYGVTIGDPQYRVGGDSWCHYLIAARTGSKNAQWLGNFLCDKPHAGVDFRHVAPRRRVYEFLFYDEKVAAEKPRRGVWPFCDGGQAFVRNEGNIPSVFTFRSGPPLGEHRYRKGELGAYGHSDPANGSFLLFRNNGLAVCGPGPTYRRETKLHNTISVDGQGQIGDTTVWMPDFLPPEFLPPVTSMKTDGNRVALFADLTKSYLPRLQIRSCLRSCYIDLDNLVAGVDLVESYDERQVEWNLHSWGEFARIAGARELSFAFGQREAKHILVMFLPQHCQWNTGLTEMVPAYPHDGRRDNYLQISRRGKRVQFVWCILLNDACHPQLEVRSDKLTFTHVESGPIHFDGTWLMPEGFDETTPA